MRETIRRRLDRLEHFSKPLAQRPRCFFKVIEADGRPAEILELIAETGEYVPFIGEAPPGILFRNVHQQWPQ
jgi:hypothetical protein